MPHRRSRTLRLGMALLAASLLGGCGTSPGTALSNLSERGRLLNQGPAARLTAAAVAAHRAEYVPLLHDFAVQAGQVAPSLPPASDPAAQQVTLAGVRDWPAVVLVGEGYVDTQCSKFLAALDELERQKRATLANLNALQSATVGIMGLAVAAQQAIGVVGVAFGLAASLFDNATASVLYQLPAASVRSIVQAQRDVLRLDESGPGGPVTRATNQGLAAARIAEYVQYCVPITIEANVAKVLNSARLQQSDGSAAIATTPARPAVTSALAPVISGIPAGEPRNLVQPARPCSPELLPADVERRLSAVTAAVRAVRTRATLDRLATSLGLQGAGALDDAPLRNRIRVEVDARVSCPGPAPAGRRMDEVAGLLAPDLGTTF